MKKKFLLMTIILIKILFFPHFIFSNGEWQVACDCFSSFGAAKVYEDKTVKSSKDFVENHLTQEK